MPEIIKRKRTVSGGGPNVKAPLSLGAEVGAAERGLIGAAGDLIERQQERHRNQDRVNKLIGIQKNYDDEQRAYFTEQTQLTGSAAFGSMDRAAKFRAEAIERYTKDIEDPLLKSQTEAYIQGRAGRMMDTIARHESGQRDSVTRQASAGMLDGILRDSRDAVESIVESMARWDETIDGQKEAGLLGPEAAEQQRTAGREQIAAASLDGMVNTDPQGAIDLIKDGTYEEFLSFKQIKEFDKTAKALLKGITADEENKAKEREKAEKDEKKRVDEETESEYVAANVKGVLTNEQVLKSTLPAARKEHWIKQIETKSAKTKKDVDKTWETKPEVMAMLIARITEEPTGVKDSEITSKQGSGLSTADTTKLLNFKQKRIKGEVDPIKLVQEKTANKRLLDAKKARLFDAANDTRNEKLWAEVTLEVEKFKIEHPDEDPNDLVTSIVEPIKTTFTQDILDLFNFGQPGTEEAIRLRREELGPVVSGIEDRKAAEQFLKDNGQLITDANIEFIMEHK